jgi:hypothetical protein
MNDASTTWVCLLAARHDSGAVWGRFDHQRPGVGPAEWTIMIGATGLLVAVALYSYVRSKRQKKEFLRNSSPQMFAELCRAHRLGRANRRLLKTLGATRGTKNACTLFVEPEYFDGTKLPAALKSAASELHQLRSELFGQS